MVLLEQYLRIFLPCGKFAGSDGAGSDSFDESLLQYRELFMQLVLVYWIDVAKLIRTEHHKAPQYRRLLLKQGVQMNVNAAAAHGAASTG